jgi:hypothetical protein
VNPKQIRQLAMNLEAAYKAAEKGLSLAYYARHHKPKSADPSWESLAKAIAGARGAAHSRILSDLAAEIDKGDKS